MNGKVFFDTNILVYAQDLSTPRKQAICEELLLQYGDVEHAAVSTQVMQEYYVNLVKLGAAPLAAKTLMNALRALDIVTTTPEMVERGIDISIRNQVSFWDALVIAAASAARCARLYTEDMNHGQVIAGVQIWNPFSG